MQSNNVNESQDHATKQAEMNDTLAPDASFFDKPKNVKIILNSFYATCLLLVILDFVVHRHIYLSFEEIPAFYAIYGFVACVLLVVLAKLMRLVLMRGEHYYDERLDEHQQVESNDSLDEDKVQTPKSIDSEDTMDELGLNSYSAPGDKK